jgi:hypothetical protein
MVVEISPTTTAALSAAWEQPQLLSEEIRTSFRPLHK